MESTFLTKKKLTCTAHFFAPTVSSLPYIKSLGVLFRAVAARGGDDQS